MNQSELIEKVAAATGLGKTQAGQAMEAAFEAIIQALTSGQEVRLAGLGVFDVAERGERQGRNPQTGETITIRATKTVRFRPNKVLKESVNSAPDDRAAAD
ncbi:MAG: HU family DNA-binding protein [Acetobacteraceae bacterium]|nr:HU family DNA-binding protein [Acetobacteraceae bacterium]